MEYERGVEFRGDPEQALEVARMAFLHAGFRFVANHARGFEAEGPGMMRSHASPLAGASRVKVTADGRRFTLEADLGAVRRIARFVTWMPILTGAVVVGALAIVFSLTQSPVPPWLLPVIAGTVVVPNLVIGPVVGRSARTRTLRALDLLVDNATLLART